jgi:hypothetical protein
MYLQQVISRKTLEKNLFFVGVLEVNDELAGSGSGSISQRHGSADPDPTPKCHGYGTLVKFITQICRSV